MAPGPELLADRLLRVVQLQVYPVEEIRRRILTIFEKALSHAPNIREPNFRRIGPEDLEFLFAAYDASFFAGELAPALGHRPLSFRLSSRMTNAGGATSRYRTATGEVSFEITIASSMLFDGFGSRDRVVTACGVECANRLEALQRIFEHELVHLTEFLCFGASDCSASRFQEIASRQFGHAAHTHSLITRRERAAESGIRVGALVTFQFEGQSLTGRVNRITKRVSVLVPHPEGLRYSDGQRYRKFYVPIGALELTHPAGAQQKRESVR